MANELRDIWLDQGLDHVTQVQYDVLLSYPNMSDLSVIELLDHDGNVTFATQKVEEVIDSADNNSDIIPPFNAYSATGDVEVGYLLQVSIKVPMLVMYAMYGTHLMTYSNIICPDMISDKPEVYI